MNKYYRSPVLIILVLVTVTYIVPSLLLALIFVNLLITCIIGGSRLSATTVKQFKLEKITPNEEPMVSIHVPCYNEPSHLVINTLEALNKLNYENFEVIILDNNTPDQSTWKPVQKRCEELGERFKFYHYDNVKGYKAGALNICYELTSKKAAYILVIDADYILDPDIIKNAIPHFKEDTGLVQFPQAYYNTSDQNESTKYEYNHFFTIYMNVANHCNTVLSTGTVSFIRKKALEEAGLWHGNSITEDVDLGLNIHQAGYCGIFVNEPMGKGLMPSDVSSITVQRERWVYGNMQTLLRYIKINRNWSWKPVISNILFLTAWFNFFFLPICTLILVSFFNMIHEDPAWLMIGKLALINILIELTLNLLFFIRLPSPLKLGLRFESFLQHLSLTYEGAVNWLKVPLFPGMGFKRTNKFLSFSDENQISNTTWLIIIMAIMGCFLFVDTILFYLLLLFIAILFLYANIHLVKQMKYTARLTKKFYA